MTIDSPKTQTASEKFNSFFKGICEKYWITDDKLKDKDITKDSLKQLIEEYKIAWEDKYNLMDYFHEMNEETLRHNAIIWAKAAIIMRNLSHNLWERALKDNDFDEFADFCDVDKSEIKGKGKFQKIFLKDSEKMEWHPLNEIYRQLREQWLSVYEAITHLPRAEEAESRWKTNIATSNNEVMEWSKMWSTMYCTGRMNTMLWILVLNEWIDYVNKHFKYAEVLRDWLSDIMDEVPYYERDEWYLNEALNYEEPHQMLIFIEDDWKEFEIDPNQIIANQLSFWMLNFDNITKKYDWNAWEVAYQMYFFDYLNNELKKEENNIDKEKTIKRLEAYNELVWWSELIIKRLIAYAIDLWDEKLEKKYKKKLQKLWEKYPCIKDKFSYHLALDSEEELQDFIHEKYWSHFTTQDVFSQYN